MEDDVLAEIDKLYEETPFPDFKLKNQQPQNAKAWIEAIYLRIEDEVLFNQETSKLIASSVCLTLKKTPQAIESFISTAVVEENYFFEMMCRCDVNETEVYNEVLDEVLCYFCNEKAIQEQSHAELSADKSD